MIDLIVFDAHHLAWADYNSRRHHYTVSSCFAISFEARRRIYWRRVCVCVCHDIPATFRIGSGGARVRCFKSLNRGVVLARTGSSSDKSL